MSSFLSECNVVYVRPCSDIHGSFLCYVSYLSANGGASLDPNGAVGDAGTFYYHNNTLGPAF